MQIKYAFRNNKIFFCGICVFIILSKKCLGPNFLLFYFFGAAFIFSFPISLNKKKFLLKTNTVLNLIKFSFCGMM